MSQSIPPSILIVGSGVFGLGTAYALARRPEFKESKITVLERVEFPAPDGSSIDASRIIRADYADSVYAKLMSQTLDAWRGEFGAEGRYTESGLAIISDDRHGSRTAAYFLRDALDNVTKGLGLKLGERDDGGQVTCFEDEAGVRKAMGTAGGLIGTKGYVNWTSGWAHAEEGIKYLRKKIDGLNRVQFLTAEVKRLLFNNGRVEGVQLSTGQRLAADLTVLATGAWTPKLIDLRGIASATGQVVTYIDINEAEAKRLSQNPVILSETNGGFIIPPRADFLQLKVARHGYGYANPITIPNPENEDENITVSLPRTKFDDPEMGVPLEGEQFCRAFLQKAVPDMGERPFSQTRICWYTDTPTGDWLITRHPKYKGLFVATGGSGHAYKFLPIIGERIVDVIQGLDRDDLGRELRERWKWPERKFHQDQVWTDDWRGGKKGMILDEEFAKGKLGAIASCGLASDLPL